MRLFNVRTCKFTQYHNNPPDYAVASHRWEAATEITFQDVEKNRNADKPGYKKLEGFVRYMKTHVPQIEWLWIDTCCINQRSDAELSEAVNSMFKWYNNSKICLAYLADVTDRENEDQFRRSVWFTRGWTLQELIAPQIVIFLTKDWQLIGHKGGSRCSSSGISLNIDHRLEHSIASITGIPRSVLLDSRRLLDYSSEEKLAWVNGRETTRDEDISYCLFGILDVAIGANYGEGAERARRRLLAEIQKENSGPKELSHAKAHQDTSPGPKFIVPFRRDRDFVSREALTDDIHTKRLIPAARVALVGLGGVGKSQLAIEYAYRLREQPLKTSVLWVHASNAARFEQSVRDVAEQVKMPGYQDKNADVLKLLWAWLCDEANGRWLVILDNVDDADYLLEAPKVTEGMELKRRIDYIPICDHGSILITSRSVPEAIKVVEYSDLIIVSPLGSKDAVLLLEKKVGSEAYHGDMEELVEALEFIPLAITQAASYIVQRGRRFSVRQYLEKLRKSERSKRSILFDAIRDHRRDKEARNSITLTWQISFEHIYRVRRSAAELLSLMSFCDRQAIPKSLVWNRDRHDDVIEQDQDDLSIRKRNNLTDLKGAYDFEIEDDSDFGSDDSGESIDDDHGTDFDKDIALLEGYSFVSVTSDASIFEMHRLVQHATQQWLQLRGRLEDCKEQYINNLCSVFPQHRYEAWSTCQILFPHVKTATALKLRRTNAALKWACVMCNAARYALDIGKIHDARDMASSSLKVRAELLGEYNQETLRSTELVALAKKALGDWRAAKELEMKTMDALLKLLGEDHHDTIIAMSNLAVTYWQLGMWKKAEELYIKVLDASSRLLGEEHLDTLTAIGNLAFMYRSQGQWKEAEELEVKVVEARTRLLGEEHPATLTGISNLASTYWKQGRWEEAENLGVKLLEARTRLLGIEHPATLIVMANLASTYRDQGRWKEAEELEVKVLEIRIRVLGEAHPDTLTALSNLALTYWNRGRWKEAEELGFKVVEERKRLLGEEHPDTLLSVSNLAMTYWNQGRLEEAEFLLEHVAVSREKVFGVYHPLTQEATSNLGKLQALQG